MKKIIIAAIGLMIGFSAHADQWYMLDGKRMHCVKSKVSLQQAKDKGYSIKEMNGIYIAIGDTEKLLLANTKSKCEKGVDSFTRWQH